MFTAAAGEKLLVIFLNGEGASRAAFPASQAMTFDEVRRGICDNLRLVNVNVNDQNRMEIRADFHNGGGADPSVPVANDGVWRSIFRNTTAPRIDLRVNIPNNVNPN